MKFIRFTDESRLEEYLQVLILSCLKEPPKTHPIPISKPLQSEIRESLRYTQTLPDNFQWKDSPWVLYAVLNEAEEIIGTVTAATERHVCECINIEYVSIRQKEQGKKVGRFMMQALLNEIKKHGPENYVLLATGETTGFYEAIGMDFAGTIKVGQRTRHFFTQKIR